MIFTTIIPPIYPRLRERFGVSWDDGVIITYGSMIHSKHPIPEEWMVHESVHVEQQKEMGAEKWWDRFLDDPQFRLEQELEAYAKQVAFIKRFVKDGNMRYRMIADIWRKISSPMYGSMISLEKAQKLLPYKD